MAIKKISEKLFKTISRNFGWKLVSLIFAIIFWFIVMNLINPTEIMTFSVNLTLLNEDKLNENGYVILNSEELKKQPVDIKVKATRPALDELARRKKEIQATVDLKQFDVLYAQNIDEAFKVMITPVMPEGYMYPYELLGFSPINAEVNLDKIAEKSYTVAVESEGEPEDGYVTAQPVVMPKTVTVKGASTNLNKVIEVKVNAELSGVTSNVAVKAVPIAVDKDGNTVADVIIEPSEVELYIGVSKQGQIVVNKPVITGEPLEEYKVVSVNWEPKYIDVIGNEGEIRKKGFITLPEIDVSGEDKSKTLEFDIRDYLNDTNLEIKNGTPTEVKVEVTIEKEEVRTLEISSEQIEITGGEKDAYELPKSVRIRIKGLSEYVSKVEADEIKAVLDVSNLKKGSAHLELLLTLPEGVSASGNNTVRVIYKGNAESEQPEKNTEAESALDSPEAEKEIQ